VNTTFYAWYDSWREAKDGTRAHGDGVGWPDLPASEIPSPAKYLREHSPAQIVDRMWVGLLHQWENLWSPFSWVSYPLVLLAGLAAAAGAYWSRARELLRAHWPLALFVVAFVSGYLKLFAWYGPIADYSDMRFTYSLHLPLLFAAFVALERLLDDGKSAWMRRVQLGLVLLLGVDLVFWLPAQLSRFNWYGK
jgi:hypothetical protein